MKKLFSCCISILFFSFLLAQPGPQHDLHFSKLATAWDEAIPLGNGKIGALVWQRADRLRFSLDGSELWDERPMKGLHRPEFSYQWVYEQVKKGDYKIVQNYFDAPYDREAAPTKIPGGALELNTNSWGDVTSVHLFLNKALCEIKWNSGIKLTSFVQATKNRGWIRIENFDGQFSPELIAPKYVLEASDSGRKIPSNDVSRLGYKKGTIDKKGNRIVYHQPGWNGFSYEISVQWKQVKNLVEAVWTLTTNSASAASKKNEAFGKQQLSFKTDLVAHTTWWQNFWSKSSLHIPDTILEKQWYRELYKFGSTARQGAPPILLQGVWTADNGRLPPWKGDYHHDLNTEMSYWPAYSSNHLEEAKSFVQHLENNKENYKRYTKLFFGSEGIAVPGVTTLKGTEMGGWIQYALSPTVSAWLAQHYYWQWRYSMDKVFLENEAYPWFKEVARHLEQISFINEKGFRQLRLSSSPEINNNNIDAWFLQTTNYDLSLMKFVFTKATEMAKQLGFTNEVKHFNALLHQLPSYVLSDKKELMYAPGFPYKESHRHFSHAMAIHPLGLIKWEDGVSSQRIIKNTLSQMDSIGPDNWNGYSYAWLANLKARAKDGDGAAKALTIFATAFCSINSFHVNGDQTKSGYSKRTYRPFTLEGNFAFAAGLQEMLLQSYPGFIELMPALPTSWDNASFENFRADGAYLVSAKKLAGKIVEVKVCAEKGGTTTLNLPFEKYKVVCSKGIMIRRSKEGFIQLVCKPGSEVILLFR